jgi:hypothetical protein
MGRLPSCHIWRLTRCRTVRCFVEGWLFADFGEPCLKALLDNLGIWRRQRVLGGQIPMCPSSRDRRENAVAHDEARQVVHRVGEIGAGSRISNLAAHIEASPAGRGGGWEKSTLRAIQCRELEFLRESGGNRSDYSWSNHSKNHETESSKQAAHEGLMIRRASLILLCHRTRRIFRVKRRVQHGQRGSVRAIVTSSLR